MCAGCKQASLLPEFEALLHEYEEEQFPEMEFELLSEAAGTSRNNKDYIKGVQTSLNRVLGLKLSVDGIMGLATRSAIRSFQKQNGLTVDGIAGPQTERALNVVSEGAPQPGTFSVPAPAPTMPVAPGSNWETIPADQRILYVIERLVNQYNFPVNGGSGLVGNLFEESALIPNRVEGSQAATPMRAKNFRGQLTDFSAVDIMNRNSRTGVGPGLPGIGLAQWTSANRRSGLFQHQFQGQQLGSLILFNMDAQVDYLVNELSTNYRQVFNLITAPGVSVNDASDEVVYRFEVPGSVLSGGAPRRLLPRNDPQVQRTFARRRQSSQQAFRIYQNAHP